MSEEQAAFARHNGSDEPFAIASDTPEAAVEHAFEPPDLPAAAVTPPKIEEQPPSPDVGENRPLLAALLAPDQQGFLRALIGVAACALTEAAGDDGSLGLVLARLGNGLAEEQDAEFAFQDLVDSLERRRLGDTPLAAVSPIIGAFVARIAGEPLQPDQSPRAPAEMDDLLRAAEAMSAAALAAGGARSWRRLPDLAATIGERAARRGLSTTELAAALPRLTARFGLTGPDDGERIDVIATTDYPRGAPPRAEAAEEPRRMVISGPVEIVILDR